MRSAGIRSPRVSKSRRTVSFPSLITRASKYGLRLFHREKARPVEEFDAAFTRPVLLEKPELREEIRLDPAGVPVDVTFDLPAGASTVTLSTDAPPIAVAGDARDLRIRLTGLVVTDTVVVDGCGAPMPATTLTGLATAFHRIALGKDGRG